MRFTAYYEAAIKFLLRVLFGSSMRLVEFEEEKAAYDKKKCKTK